jgi:hypothetical protein
MTSRSPTVFARRLEPSPTLVYDTYWTFAAKRQDLYFNRFRQPEGPWTSDKILAEHRFTNVYRAADKVSQFLIRDVIYSSDYSAEDTVFRTLLFKLFNKVETWKLLKERLGDPCIATFDVNAFDAVLSEALRSGSRIYSAAYIMPNGPRRDASSFKHRTHLDLLAQVLHEHVHQRVLRTQSMKELYDVLLTLPSIGPFLAYQYAIDLLYSAHIPFTENDFVQPGPGALNGLAKCFSSLGEYSPADAIAWVTERQQSEFAKRGLSFKTLWGRSLHLIDCQNLFCEVDKYARVAHPEFSHKTGRSRIKQKYSSAGPLPRPWFPPKWNVIPVDADFVQAVSTKMDSVGTPPQYTLPF